MASPTVVLTRWRARASRPRVDRMQGPKPTRPNDPRQQRWDILNEIVQLLLTLQSIVPHALVLSPQNHVTANVFANMYALLEGRAASPVLSSSCAPTGRAGGDRRAASVLQGDGPRHHPVPAAAGPAAARRHRARAHL